MNSQAQKSFKAIPPATAWYASETAQVRRRRRRRDVIEVQGWFGTRIILIDLFSFGFFH